MGMDVTAPSPPPFFSEDRWICSYEEVVTDIEAFLAERNMEAVHMRAEEDIIGTFLEIRHHLVKNPITKVHHENIESILDLMCTPGWVSPSSSEEQQELIRDRAEEMIETPELFWNEVTSVLNEVIVGEGRNKVTLACLVLGMEHIYITGDSSSGKTHVKDNVLRLFPPEWLVSYGSMSQKAVQYTDFKYQGPGPEDNPLVRILNLQEFVGVGEEQDKQFRLLSGDDGGMVWTTTVQKTEDGEQKYVTMEGRTPPLCFITSTTRSALNEENLTRAWRIIPDPDIEQTKDILRRDNWLAALPHRRPRIHERLNIIRECIRLLDPKPWKGANNKFRVMQPFLQLCEFPYEKVRVRRDRSKVERMAAILTIINQRDRLSYEYNGQAYLIGTAGDLAASLFLTRDILEHTLLGIDDKAIRIFNVVKKWEKENEHTDDYQGMTIHEIMETGKLPSSYSQDKIRLVSNELVKLGFLQSRKLQEQGTPLAYKVKMDPDATLSVRWNEKESNWNDVKEFLEQDDIFLPSDIDEKVLDESFPECIRALVDEEESLIEKTRARRAAKIKAQQERGTLVDMYDLKEGDSTFKKSTEEFNR